MLRFIANQQVDMPEKQWDAACATRPFWAIGKTWPCTVGGPAARIARLHRLARIEPGQASEGTAVGPGADNASWSA
jgi:hypothetical protein